MLLTMLLERCRYYSVSVLLVRLLGILLLLFASGSNAHLLNMTNAEFSVAEKGSINVKLEVDLSRYFPSRLAYYEASQGPCSLLTKHRDILDNLLAAIALSGVSLADTSLEYKLENNWSDIDCSFPEQNKSVYLDPLQWPKVTITGLLEGSEKQQQIDEIKVRFLTSFIFEEPIAVTFRYQVTQKKMTRWLIALQDSPRFSLSASEASNSSEEIKAGFYFAQGVYHILPFGIDHLIFVLALAMAAKTLRILLFSLTVFTLAHTCSLVASYFNVVNISAAVVEPLIALTIAWAGYEVLRHSPFYYFRLVVIFCFGLIHGLGFAGALLELGLPGYNALLLLLVFNLGVEVGQILFVMGLLVLALLLNKTGLTRNTYRVPVGLVICAIGLVWAILRVAL